MKLILLLSSLTVTLLSAAQPNVVFFLADDLGWSDTTLYGKTQFYQTPNLERLAKRGMTFTRAYSASPLCSPTRSAVLTGLSPARTGITTPNCHLQEVVLQATQGKGSPPNKHASAPTTVTRLKTDYPTLPKALKAAGYATGHFGKWHLGTEPYSPLEHGFDVDLPHWPGPGPAGSFVAPWKFPQFKEKSPGEHLEDRMADEAVAWMEKQQDRPFFLNYWQFSVHAPFDAKKELIEKHRSRVDPKNPQRSPTYAAMVESMDDAVGRLLDALDRLKLSDLTIIIFTADNGGNMYNEIDGTTPTSNAPLRGGKATMFEGGTRVPCVVAWPGVTSAGSQQDTLLQSEDFFPTLLAGLHLAPVPGQLFDGQNLLSAFKGDSMDRGPIFQYFPHDPGVPDWLPPSVSVHQGDWKLIRLFHAGEKAAHRYLLFDLKQDISETKNLAADNPTKVTELDALIEGFLQRTHAVVPVPNPQFDPSQYRPELEGKPQSKAKGKTQARSSAKGSTPAGWQASADVELTRQGGALLLRSSGGDPWISTRQLPKPLTAPLKLQFRLMSNGKGPVVIYYGDTAEPGFSKTRSRDVSVPHDGKAHDVELTLPVTQLTALRIDPGNGPGQMRIEGLQLNGEALLTPVKPGK